ncbi:MAG: toll/interleukin-1 receptor domain-containing protein, partial [Steroidobacteraceae bacterium]
MTDPQKAVFLSYASQDAEAAKHIADALHTAGIEVWFDQSALRGGDAWDQKIRREIRDCTLFLPVISQNTQARTEGYFRLEWHLADQRTHLMTKGRPFLLPVCIDETRDADAEVPDSFTVVQWTRLPAGETPATFVEQVSRLLSQDRKSAPAPVRVTSGAPVQD